MITIQNQNFGVEIELTGITRQAAAQVIADYYGTIGTRFMGTAYKTYEAVDNKGRRWKCMRDASITPQRRVNGHVVDANDEYKCEVVAPILQYEDIPDLQAIVRALVKKGAMANASCGIDDVCFPFCVSRKNLSVIELFKAPFDNFILRKICLNIPDAETIAIRLILSAVGLFCFNHGVPLILRSIR